MASDPTRSAKQKPYTATGNKVVGPRNQILQEFSTDRDARKAADLATLAVTRRGKRIAPDLGFIVVQVDGKWYLKFDDGNGLLPASDVEVRLWKALESRPIPQPSLQQKENKPV